MKFLTTIFFFLALVPQCIASTRYVDAVQFPTVNGMHGGFERIQNRNRLPDQVAKMGEYSTGLALVFTTDSRNLSARWVTRYPAELVNMTALMQSGLDLYILRDSAWVHAGVGFPSISGNEHSSGLVSNMDGSTHTCLLYLPLWNALEGLQIGVDDDATIEGTPSPFSGRIAMVGSSITHGASASRPGLAFPAMLQRRLGCEVVNLGFAGQCRLEEFYADMLAESEADIYVVDGFSNPSPDEIHSRLKPFIDRVRASRPDVPIVLLQTEVREVGNFDLEFRRREADKRAAAVEEMSRIQTLPGYENVYFLDPGMPLGDDHDATVDGTHPTDAGFARIVDHLANYLSKFL